MAPPEERVEAARQDGESFDLLQKITPYLDKHLVLNMLPFHKELGRFKEEDIVRAQLKLLEGTNMIDWAVELYGELGQEAPESLTSRREEVVERIEKLRESEYRLLEVLEDEASVKKIHTELQTLNDICEAFDVTLAQIDGLVPFAKLQFECGNYAVSRQCLLHYRSIMEKEQERFQSALGLRCLWGAVASSILEKQYDEAADSVATLSDMLESSKQSKKEVLIQKTYLLHWNLFILFCSETSPLKAMDYVLTEKSMSVMSLSCPHLLRYVAALLILQRRLRNSVKETVWIINQESNGYSDPITRFLVALFVDLDFDEAQKQLLGCKEVCQNDFFLAQHWKDFEENARLLIFETYCRIHQSINIDMIAERLNMTPVEAELWIVKLIQSAKLDARIDSEKGRVVMSKAPPSTYQQVIERTKNLSFRSTMLLSNLDKRDNELKVKA